MIAPETMIEKYGADVENLYDVMGHLCHDGLE